MNQFFHRPAWQLAVFSGFLLGLSFQPFHLGFLAWVGLIPLYHIWINSDANDNVRNGFLFGMTHNFVAFYWIGFNSGASFGVVFLSLIAAVLYLSLHWAVAGWIFGKLKSEKLNGIIFPFLLVSMEWIRSFGSLGFPWGNIALSQLDWMPLLQIMEVTGSYGVTFWVVSLNVVLYMMLFQFDEQKKNGILIWIVMLGLWFFGRDRMNYFRDSDEHIEVAILQPNIDPNAKWDMHIKEETIAYMDSLHGEAINLKPDLILFPETALPAYLKLNRRVRNMIQKRIDESGIPVLTGTVDRIKNSDGNKVYYNSSMFLSPKSSYILYNKIHLVPFAEYIPFSAQFPLLKELNFGQGNFTHGDEYTLFNWDGNGFSNLICYESSIPNLVRKFVQQGARFLTIQTNDGWLGESAGPYQHYNVARLRAIENRIPIVRSANTGISGLILANGESVGEKPLETTHVFKVKVPLGNSGSFYSRNGDIFAMVCFVIFIFLGHRSWLKNQS